jgi:hypothetical protein
MGAACLAMVSDLLLGAENLRFMIGATVLECYYKNTASA